MMLSFINLAFLIIVLSKLSSIISIVAAQQERNPTRQLERHLQSSCTAPPNGCKNGLWSTTSCACQCIPPFCPDWINTAEGACTSPTSNCGGNPWINCDSSSSTTNNKCPWWNDHLWMAGKCASGPSVPPGIWLIYESVEECCAVNHPESRVCDPNKKFDMVVPSLPPAGQLATTSEDSNNEEDVYEVVPIQFTIQRLPLDADIDVQEVRDEMFAVLEKALSNIEDRIEGLMIESVQENVALTNLALIDAQPAKNDAAATTELVVYYDVTVVPDQSQPEYYVSIIIDNILEAYGNVVDEENGDYVYLGYIKLKYFAEGINLLWCTARTAAGDTFDKCNETDEMITVKFRLSNIPSGDLDIELLIQEMIDIYRDVILLEEELDGSSGTSRDMLVDLDITGIEYKWIDLPLSYNTTNDDDSAKDVFLNIKLARSKKLLGKNDIIGTAINEKLQSFKSTILNRIQDYTDNKSMDLELNWCIDDDGEYNAECPNTTLGGAKVSESTPTVQKFADMLSNYWVIIAITALCVITTCCFIKCIAALVTQREESKTERNMMNYIYTGQNYSKPPRPPRNSRKTSSKAAVVEPPQRRRHGNQQQQEAQRQRHRPRRQTSAHKSRKGPHRQSKRREMKMLANAPYDSNNQQLLLKQKQQRLAKRLASYNNTNDPQQNTLALPKKETEYQLEQMPTFVFPYDNDDGNGGGQQPGRDEDLTTRDPEDGTEMFMIENGTWFVDDDDEFV